MKTPAFWFEQDSAIAAALSLLSPFYLAGHLLHKALANPYQAQIPIICVGNLVAGGSGKTPAALALMDLVRATGLAASPCFLTRGYGGRQRAPCMVDKKTHTAADVGDEALLLAARATTIVAANRKQGAIYAQRAGHDLIIMDDGLQNPSLNKDLKLIVVDGATGFGNFKLLPAGPLREPLESGFAEADGFVIVGEDRQGIAGQIPYGIPVFAAVIEPREWNPDKAAAYIGFSGLAHPEKFRATITKTGAKLAGFHAFPDHYKFTEDDLRRLTDEANKKQAKLITTEKDAVRLPPGMTVEVLPVALTWMDEFAVNSLLREKLRT